MKRLSFAAKDGEETAEHGGGRRHTATPRIFRIADTAGSLNVCIGCALLGGSTVGKPSAEPPLGRVAWALRLRERLGPSEGPPIGDIMGEYGRDWADEGAAEGENDDTWRRTANSSVEFVSLTMFARREGGTE